MQGPELGANAELLNFRQNCALFFTGGRLFLFSVLIFLPGSGRNRRFSCSQFHQKFLTKLSAYVILEKKPKQTKQH